MRASVKRFLEAELDFLFDVTPLARPPGACAPRSGARPRRAAEERVEEVRKRIFLPEHLARLLFGHRTEAAALAAPSHVGVPSWLRPAARRAALFVGAPVRAELVVLLPL